MSFPVICINILILHHHTCGYITFSPLPLWILVELFLLTYFYILPQSINLSIFSWNSRISVTTLSLCYPRLQLYCPSYYSLWFPVPPQLYFLLEIPEIWDCILYSHLFFRFPSFQFLINNLFISYTSVNFLSFPLNIVIFHVQILAMFFTNLYLQLLDYAENMRTFKVSHINMSSILLWSGFVKI